MSGPSIPATIALGILAGCSEFSARTDAFQIEPNDTAPIHSVALHAGLTAFAYDYAYAGPPAEVRAWWDVVRDGKHVSRVTPVAGSDLCLTSTTCAARRRGEIVASVSPVLEGRAYRLAIEVDGVGAAKTFDFGSALRYAHADAARSGWFPVNDAVEVAVVPFRIGPSTSDDRHIPPYQQQGVVVFRLIIQIKSAPG